MAVVIINPNSTASMTEAMLAQAREAAPGLAFEAWTSTEAPPAIQGAEDGAVATPPLLELVQRAADQGADGIMIGCFDDTALSEAAALASCPVIGIGQAAYHYAVMRHWRFSVVTTLAVSVPVIEQNIAAYGLGAFASRVRASEIPVLDLESDPAGSAKSVLEEARTAAAEDDIHAVILGCAGMLSVAQDVQASLRIPVVDPVWCAARWFNWHQA
ncbi:Hydantoin racemase [Candidatus Rhodobacter oscarellae]|uniref:Hydantoin racemase n=1 Tax=Candidatus Rhodobacter oscarellae TaxID=1675527 RepID=A0A0J9EDY2_9RHOB|nr:aspartate/glutamate racemase family protein [Candidatus Rhodobacter lobularis]KMW60841.1 Hydantoin racemase [Candidatus Rhodobacter lobularis]